MQTETRYLLRKDIWEGFEKKERETSDMIVFQSPSLICPSEQVQNSGGDDGEKNRRRSLEEEGKEGKKQELQFTDHCCFKGRREYIKTKTQ